MNGTPKRATTETTERGLEVGEWGLRLRNGWQVNEYNYPLAFDTREEAREFLRRKNWVMA